MSKWTDIFQKRGEFEAANGAKAGIRQASNCGFIVFPTHKSSGAMLAQFKITIGADGVPACPLTNEPQGFYIPQNHNVLDFAKNQVLEEMGAVPTVSPESIAAGATFQNMTAATDTDKANYNAIQLLKSFLGL